MGSSKLLWFLPLNLYIGMPRGNGVDWEEPLIPEERKSERHESKSDYSNSQPNNDHNDMSSGANQNVQVNMPDRKIMKDSASMSSLYNKNSNEVSNII
jgi:hypothetical protein